MITGHHHHLSAVPFFLVLPRCGAAFDEAAVPLECDAVPRSTRWHRKAIAVCFLTLLFYPNRSAVLEGLSQGP